MASGRGVPGFAAAAVGEDDGSPPAALAVAAAAVREFNHRSLDGFDDRAEGWTFPADAYRAVGELLALATGLEQACEQIIRPLRVQLDVGHISIDPWTRFEGDPAGAVEETSLGLGAAVQASHQLVTGMQRAREALAFAAYSGPELED